MAFLIIVIWIEKVLLTQKCLRKKKSSFSYSILIEKRCSSTTSKDNDDYDIIDNFSLMEDSTTVDVNKPLTTAASDWLIFKVTLW